VWGAATDAGSSRSPEGNQRAGDGHPLLLAAGQLGGPPPELVPGQAHPGCRVLDVRLSGATAVKAERERYVLRHRQLGQQVQLLKHEADALPSQHRLLALGQPGQFLPAQPHRAG
jgi:hypothetical protein